MATETSRWWKSNQVNRSSEVTPRSGVVVEWRGGRGGDARRSLVCWEGEPRCETLSSWTWT